MTSARLAHIFAVTSFYALTFISPIVASDYQQCTTSSTCVIGEFLYDDSYLPITGATCTLTAKNPDNTSFLAGAAMTSGADGWYSYTVSTSSTTGLYHASICCDTNGEHLCLDKSFEVKSESGSSLTAESIWNYSGRTLTSYGSLVSDIWGYSSRSLTSFGSLVGDIWGYSGRTLSSFDFSTSSTPAPSTLQNIVAEQTKQRELLEKLVNAPVVTLELSDGDTPDLSLKLETSKKLASTLYDSVQSSKSRLLTLSEKWSRMDADTLTKEIASLSQIWTDPSSLAGLTKSWDTPTLSNIKTASLSIKSSLSTLLSSTSLSKPQLAPSSITDIIASLNTIESELGDVTSSSTDSTFYGYLASVSDKDQLFIAESQKLAALLDDWDGTGETILRNKLESSSSKILAINEFPGGEAILEPSNKQATGKQALKNLAFSLGGLVSLNRNKLASAQDAPIRGLWLEEGSIIFRAVITNPSTLVAQSAPVKFLLPKELKKEDIITIDPSLSASYDTVADALSVSGTFDLSPGTTRIVAVEVQDIWQLNQTDLDHLLQKASDLMTPLQKSPLLSQGLALKSEIQNTIQKLETSHTKVVKPENRIQSYRQAQLELQSAKSNLTQLENLVAQATSNSSIIGFVGGVSTTAVFGIILVVVAGFVFLSIYFKKLSPALAMPTAEFTHMSVATEPVAHLSPLVTSTSPSSSLTSSKPSWQGPAFIAAVVIVTAVSTIALTRLASPRAGTTPAAVTEVAAPTPSPTETPSPSPKQAELAKPAQESTGPRLEVPEDSSVNIRNKPSSDADIVMAIKESQDVLIFKSSGDWRQIGFQKSDELKGYWVNAKFIIEP